MLLLLNFEIELKILGCFLFSCDLSYKLGFTFLDIHEILSGAQHLSLLLCQSVSKTALFFALHALRFEASLLFFKFTREFLLLFHHFLLVSKFGLHLSVHLPLLALQVSDLAA